MLYWEFDTKENYGRAQKNLYKSYWKSMERCLVVPHDKYFDDSSVRRDNLMQLAAAYKKTK